MAQERISVYNIADLKNTSDDAMTNYLNSLGFKQSHRLTDVRLALGYGSLLVAGACFGWDYKFGFEPTKYYSAAAVLVYMALSAALTLWARYAEGDTVYVGTAPSGETISIATSTEKYTPTYNMDVTVTAKNGPARTLTISPPFSQWFDSAGGFVAPAFQAVLAASVSVIAQADPKRAPAAKAKAKAEAPTTVASAYSPAMLEALAAAAASDSAGGVSESDTAAATGSSGKKKGGKRRKA